MISISRFLVVSTLAVLVAVPAMSRAQADASVTDLTDHDAQMLDSGLVSPFTNTSNFKFDPSVPTINTFTGSQQITVGASAGGFGDARTFSDLVDRVIVYFNYAIYLLTAATVVYTVRGAFNMIGSEEKREDGKTAVYYGIIGLFVMMSIWGLVNILDATFRLSGNAPIAPPVIQRTGP